MQCFSAPLCSWCVHTHTQSSIVMWAWLNLCISHTCWHCSCAMSACPFFKPQQQKILLSDWPGATASPPAQSSERIQIHFRCEVFTNTQALLPRRKHHKLKSWVAFYKSWMYKCVKPWHLLSRSDKLKTCRRFKLSVNTQTSRSLKRNSQSVQQEICEL